MEVARKAYLASLVPVILNAILNEHQIVADIVAFVNKGDFPRSRLGEKQRGKILASWVTSKMRTMAQFGIRDADGGLSDVTETVEPRHSSTSLRNSSVLASSLRNTEPAPKILEQCDLEKQQEKSDSFSMPNYIAELPTHPYSGSMNDSPPLREGSTTVGDNTPTESKAGHFELAANPRFKATDENISFPVGASDSQTNSSYKPSEVPPPVGPKPSNTAPQLAPLPATEAREGDLWTLPSQRPAGPSKTHIVDEDENQWPQEAIMHMNLARR